MAVISAFHCKDYHCDFDYMTAILTMTLLHKNAMLCVSFELLRQDSMMLMCCKGKTVVGFIFLKSYGYASQYESKVRH